MLCASSQVRTDLGDVGQVLFLPSGFVSRSRSVCLDHRSVAERMVLGSALHVFQYEGGLPGSKWIFGLAFKVAWPRCWHVVGVEAHGQANKSSRSCVVRVPQTLCQASLQQQGAKQRGGVALDQWPPSRVQKSILCVRVRRTFQSLVNSVIFHQLSRCPRRLVTDICDRPSKHVVLSLGRCRDSSSGLAPKQLIPSELLGRVVGGLNWHVVGVEPPKQVSQELDDFRDEGTSNTLPGFVTTARFPNFDAQLRRVL